MAKKADFVLNMPGLNEIMKSDAMKKHLHQVGQQVARSAGKDYDSTTYDLTFAAIENVYPTTAEAGKDNYENNTLLKALGSTGISMKK